MNDLIRYNNLLCEQGLDSDEAAGILAAHDGDEDFARRARFVRFAIEARKVRLATAARRKRMLAIGLILLGVSLIGLAVLMVL